MFIYNLFVILCTFFINLNAAKTEELSKTENNRIHASWLKAITLHNRKILVNLVSGIECRP